MEIPLPPTRILCCDWGTTNVRAFLVALDGEVIGRRRFPFGVSKLAPGEAAARFQDPIRFEMDAQQHPAILCGMIGSNLGWTVVPYRTCPIDLKSLAAALFEVVPGPCGVWIVPGIQGPGIAGAPDVMRGEETQILGWVTEQSGRERGRHLVCHPGTHAKWALVEDGSIVRFVTAMTGELFEMLRNHSILRTVDASDDPESFDEGVDAAGDGGALSARLFTARARMVTGDRPKSDAAYLSGLLIGAEISSVPQLLETSPDQPVTIIGDAELGGWYSRALSRLGRSNAIHDGESAAVAGLMRMAEIGGVT
jgi:2-dehydro-3-deoxygalactonokinase